MTQVKALEKRVSELAPVDTPTTHFFTTGLYTRQTELPAGCIAVGKRHKDCTMNILIKGKMTVVMDNDPDTKVTLTAPCAFESEAGVKKMVYCHEDSIILNVHRSDKTDLEELEAALIIREEDGECTDLGYGLFIEEVA